MYQIMYLRKSRADVEAERRGKFETLKEHEWQLTELAERLNLNVAKTYRELVSGETIAARVEFQKLLKDIEDESCSGVLVHAVDRLGRGDPLEYGYVLMKFKQTRTLIITPTKTFDTNNPADLQQLKLQMFVSNIEFDHIRERLASGSRAACERGCYIMPTPPFGYEKATINGQHTLIPSDDAAAVKLMFELASQGVNKGQIAKRLEKDGIKTMYGHRWKSSNVGCVLSNPVYKGFIRYGLTHRDYTIEDGRRKAYRSVTPETAILAKGLHEPLVSAELWEAAQNVFESPPLPRSRDIQNPMAGVLRCGKCGKMLVRQKITGATGLCYDRLHHAYNTECQVKSVSMGYVWEKLLVTLEELLEQRSYTVTLNNGSELEAVDQALRAERGKLDKLLELFYADAITAEEFKDRRNQSRELVDTLERRRKELHTVTIDYDTAEVFEAFRSPHVTPAEKNAALKSFVRYVDYWELDTARKNRTIKLDITFI